MASDIYALESHDRSVSQVTFKFHMTKLSKLTHNSPLVRSMITRLER